MPRKPRMYLPGVPCHIIQRGNNREPTFYAEQDYQFYLSCLGDAIRRYEVYVHAYVLMTNHVHLLATPQYKESISLTMQSVGRRYVQYVNKEYARSGTLWEGRHKSSVVDADNYLLTCSRYIELNPVAARMVNHPSDYKWSSFRTNAYGEQNNLITHHDIYRRIGSCDADRQLAYLKLFKYAINEMDVQLIERAASCSMPLGDNRFRQEIEAALERRVGNMHRGRPGKRL